jgi:hypothetical protein
VGPPRQKSLPSAAVRCRPTPLPGSPAGLLLLWRTLPAALPPGAAPPACVPAEEGVQAQQGVTRSNDSCALLRNALLLLMCISKEQGRQVQDGCAAAAAAAAASGLALPTCCSRPFATRAHTLKCRPSSASLRLAAQAGRRTMAAAAATTTSSSSSRARAALLLGP